ncbi:GDSL-type esterase/lipase family protein [Streptomyces albogriseolus]
MRSNLCRVILTRRRSSGGAFLLVLVLSMALILAGSALPGVTQEAAAAEPGGCSAHATSFATAPVEEGTAALRLGCARDAGGLRSLASGDNDLVAALDFNPGAQPDLLRQQMQDMVDAIRGDQADGLSLSRALTLNADRNSVGYYQEQDDGVSYDGSVHVVGDSLVMVVPAGDISTTGFWDGFWKKFVTGLVSTATAVAATALCLAAFAPGAAAAAPVCGAVAGALSGGVSELMSAALDGKPIDGEAWGAALATAMWSALAGAFLGAFVSFASESAASLITNAQKTLRGWAVKLGNWANPLGYVADVLNGNVVNRLLETIQRLNRGVGASDIHLRIMPLGDSITYGTGSSSGAGYRSTLYVHLNQQDRKVEYVGSQRSGPALSPIANEGHPGWLIKDIAGIADSVLTTYRPNVVLLHIGTNDMSNNVDPGGAPARLGSLIDQILRYDPGVTLLVSTIVPSSFPGTAERIATYNAAIPGVVEARRAAGKNVWLVDMDAVTTADLADGLHPNDRGYQKMAGAFYDGLVSAGQAGRIEGPDDGGAPGGGPVKGWIPQETIASGTFSGGTSTVVYADLDGDGRADHLKVNPDSSVQAWINGGPNPKEPTGGADWLWYPQQTIASGVGTAGNTIRFADLNGDGRADYLKVNPDSSVQAWINGGPNPKEPTGGADWLWYPQQTIASGVGTAGNTIRFADLNGDRRADYLQVNPDSSVQAWINGGPNPKEPTGGADWLWYPQGSVASGVLVDGARIQFADLNNDGRADYLDVNPQNGATRAWINYG